jgi:hypothetical protein
VLPIDLVPLVSYNGRVFPNEARPRERMGAQPETGSHLIETALEQWLSLSIRRNAWISARRQRLLGLVSTRRRGGRTAWEIDSLIDTTPERDAVPGLLECAIQAGGKAGVEKVFLRLEEDSPLLPVVTHGGFFPYSTETLYVSARTPKAEPAPMRPFCQADAYPAFRLYNGTLPERLRRQEAATFAEWQASLERSWLKDGVQMVMDGDGALSANVGAARQDLGLMVDAVVDDRARLEIDSIIATVAAAAGHGEAPVMVLAPDEGGLGSRLELCGFTPQTRYVSLTCRTTRVARLPKMVPAAIPNGAVIT